MCVCMCPVRSNKQTDGSYVCLHVPGPCVCVVFYKSRRNSLEPSASSKVSTVSWNLTAGLARRRRLLLPYVSTTFTIKSVADPPIGCCLVISGAVIWWFISGAVISGHEHAALQFCKIDIG